MQPFKPRRASSDYRAAALLMRVKGGFGCLGLYGLRGFRDLGASGT